MAREADVVIGDRHPVQRLHHRVSTAFADPGVRFVNVNVAAADAVKHAGAAVVADAREALRALTAGLAGWSAATTTARRPGGWPPSGTRPSTRAYALGCQPRPAQSEVIGVVNDVSGPRDVVVCAAGSMPGDLHKLWRARDPKGYHVEYGYSCMGYEIAGGLGVKLAAPTGTCTSWSATGPT